MPKKISDITAPPPAPPPTLEEKIVKFLDAHPTDAFTWQEIGTGVGLFTDWSKVSENMAGFYLTVGVAQFAYSLASKEGGVYGALFTALNKLYQDKRINGVTKNFIPYYWTVNQ